MNRIQHAVTRVAILSVLGAIGSIPLPSISRAAAPQLLSKPSSHSRLESALSPTPMSPTRTLVSSQPLDDFGYRWELSSEGWLDAPNAIDTGITPGFSPPAVITASVALGFPFRFYDRTYEVVEIRNVGRVFLSFTPSTELSDLFNPTFENFIELGFAHSLSLQEGGKILTQAGGITPNRYLLVQWLNATSEVCSRSGCQYVAPFDLQMILKEDGDILMHYRPVSGKTFLDLAGFKMGDWAGLDQASATLPIQTQGLSSWRVIRPPPQARLHTAPDFQSQWINEGASGSLTFTVQNRGDGVSDTFEIDWNAPWPMNMSAGDGIPLTDTNHNGTVDTGAILRGEVATYTAHLTTPAMVSAGTWITAQATVRSAQDVTRMRSMTFQGAVPVPFAMTVMQSRPQTDPVTYGFDNESRLFVMEPATQRQVRLDALKYITSTSYRSPPDDAIAELPSGDFLVARIHNRYPDDAPDYHIEYVIVNARGEAVSPVRKIYGFPNGLYSGAQGLQLAIAPNGHIGMLTSALNPNGNFNISFPFAPVFCVLDASGALIAPPTMLGLRPTSVYGIYDDLALAATSDNRFVIAWREKATDESSASTPAPESRLVGTVRSDTGAVIQPPTILVDINHSELPRFRALNMVAMGERVLVFYEDSEGLMNSSRSSARYFILDKTGHPLTPPLALEGYDSRIVDFNPSVGRIRAFAISPEQAGLLWVSRTYQDEPITYEGQSNLTLFLTLIKADDTTSKRPIILRHFSAGASGRDDAGYGLEVLPDFTGRFLILWRELIDTDLLHGQLSDQPRMNLNALLIDSTGAVVTPPTLVDTQPTYTGIAVPTGYAQYRFASHRAGWSPSPKLFLEAPPRLGVSPRGTVGIPIEIINQGLSATGSSAHLITSSQVILTATLAAGVTYVNGVFQNQSQITPTITMSQGQTILAWQGLSIDALGRALFQLVLQGPNAAYGTQSAIELDISSQSAGSFSSIHSTEVQLWTSRQIYLPGVSRD